MTRFCEGRDHLAPSAEEINAQLVLSSRREKAAMRSTPATRSGAGWPDARSAQTTDMPSATVRWAARQDSANSRLRRIMHRWKALAVMTMWEVRGARQNSRQRATAISIGTASKEMPSNSDFPVCIIDYSRITKSRVAGMLEAGRSASTRAVAARFPMRRHACW